MSSMGRYQWQRIANQIGGYGPAKPAQPTATPVTKPPGMNAEQSYARALESLLREQTMRSAGFSPDRISAAQGVADLRRASGYARSGDTAASEALMAPQRLRESLGAFDRDMIENQRRNLAVQGRVEPYTTAQTIAESQAGAAGANTSRLRSDAEGSSYAANPAALMDSFVAELQARTAEARTRARQSAAAPDVDPTTALKLGALDLQKQELELEKQRLSDAREAGKTDRRVRDAQANSQIAQLDRETAVRERTYGQQDVEAEMSALGVGTADDIRTLGASHLSAALASLSRVASGKVSGGTFGGSAGSLAASRQFVAGPLMQLEQIASAGPAGKRLARQIAAEFLAQIDGGLGGESRFTAGDPLSLLSPATSIPSALNSKSRSATADSLNQIAARLRALASSP